MNSAVITPVRHTMTVPLSAEQAFALFTSGFNSWWPQDHIGPADLADVVIEPRDGGRWYELGTDGTECDWGAVLAWQPPGRLVLAWQLSPRWEYDPDPAHASEIEVRFTETAGQTTVEFEHRCIERHGEGADSLREQIGSAGGWPAKLAGYARAAQAAA